ncbi:MAG TPA: DUF2461 domain-containing protein [Bacteroidia bacterium]|nr:DUF2461 domain-containing protein [Bacteroidia bacterium]
MIRKETFDFLRKLKKNNDRAWFEKNKPAYETAKENVEETLGAILKNIRSFDKRIDPDLPVKKYMFRIYRDVRFSKDKAPYKTHFGANMNPGGKKEHAPGYYMHLEPGGSFFAGGMWMPEPPMLAKIRQEIDYNLPEFQSILSNKTFKKYFGKLSDEDKLSTTPKGYLKDHPAIELIKLKSFIVVSDISDKDVLSKNYIKKATQIFQAMKPLNDFLQRAID